MSRDYVVLLIIGLIAELLCLFYYSGSTWATGWILLLVVRVMGVTFAAGTFSTSGKFCTGAVDIGFYCLADWSVRILDLLGYGLLLCTGW